MPPSPNDSTQTEGVLFFPASEGRLQLVGAGPGDPELLTIKALRAIEGAELVVADALVPEAILSLSSAPRFIAPSKRVGKADQSQDELMNVALEGLRKGLRVIRLKNGDPFMFGRGGEEVLFFRKHGFEAEVIPGISSSLSAPLSGLIPVTHRGVADQLLITTAQGKGGSIPPLPPYAPNRTTVFLMPVARLDALTQALIDHGFPAECPVGIVERATFPDQRVLRATLATIAALAAAEEVKAPATVVVGEAVNALL